VAVNTKKIVKSSKVRSYLNKDFDGFRSDLLQYAKMYFSDRIEDFSEPSVGGLLLDLAAYVGDVMSFYLDHQYKELNSETATETKNIERLLRTAGIPIVGSSPATVIVDFYIEVRSKVRNDVYSPDLNSLPVILKGTTVRSNNGVGFELIDDIDYSKRDSSGLLLASIQVGRSDANGNPTSFIMKRMGTCVSGETHVDSFSIPDVFVPYRTITLNSDNVTAIMSVKDSGGNEYYEVGSLAEDVVYRALPNVDYDREEVDNSLSLQAAPYRYVKTVDFNTKMTMLQFGSGKADTLDNDVIPDPSQFAIPLYGKKTFKKFSIDPGNFLNTQTMGISPINTTIVVNYRRGGGLHHNVASESIRTIDGLQIFFPKSPPPNISSSVRSSLEVINKSPAVGGEEPPGLNDLKALIPSARNAQSRIVTKQDLLARIYSMPSEFGRVFRVGVRSNMMNPLASQVYIVSRNKDRQLTMSSDTLKKNLRVYLNKFRLISDAIDILDSSVVNIGIKFIVTVNPASNRSLVVTNVINRLKDYFKTGNFNIDEPIIISDLTNLVINVPDVVSLARLGFFGISGTSGTRNYSNFSFEPTSNIQKGMIVGPPGSIFEMRYPDFDILGSAI
tara:strand:+ start:2015 stop:3859 length:1845 start_codon:yes stop_codon:yes gene_type:complete